MADADPQLPQADFAAQEPVEEKKPRRWLRIVVMLAVPIALAAGGVWYWLGQQGRVGTDNAYVKQDMVAISAEVGGRIVETLVREDDHVKAGDLLFRIDPEPYQLQVQQANAAIANAQVAVQTMENDTDLTGVDIAAAQEDIAFARSR